MWERETDQLHDELVVGLPDGVVETVRVAEPETVPVSESVCEAEHVRDPDAEQVDVGEEVALLLLERDPDQVFV